MARSTALVTHQACGRHDPGPDHADAVGRLPALLHAVHADIELRGTLVGLQGRPAGEEDLLRVHSREHVERVRAAAEEARRTGERVWLDADTPVGVTSWDAAVASAGCAMTAADRVIRGFFRTAFALSRPPGHHASRDRAMGFCLFNNVAVAVRRLQQEQRLGDVLVVDLDAHHGNGTQEIFYEDPSVYVLSLHLDDYPGTGHAQDVGAGAGHGRTRNVSLPHGTTAGEYRRHFRATLEEVLASFKPELVMLSVGLDCLSGDPEGGLELQPADLHGLTCDLLDRLPPETGGRVVGVLEGGYAVERIGGGLVEILRAFAELPPATPPSTP